MSQQLQGLFYIAVGMIALLISGATILHLLTAVFGLYCFFKGVALFNNHPHLFSQIHTIKSRFFDKF